MKFSLCLLIGVVLFSLLALSAVPAFATIGQTMAVQGRLTNSTGGLQSGTFNFSYAIWDASAGGNELWWQNNTNETDDVSGDCIGIFQTVQDGIFNQYLGSTLGCPLNISFDAEYWLELTVNDSVLAPRHRISSAAYTFHANITDYIGPSTGAGAVDMNTQNITNIGYVGIGTTSPTALLEMYGSTPGLIINSSGAAENPVIRIKAAGTEKGAIFYLGSVDSNFHVRSASGTNLSFDTDGSNTPKMLIDTSGNVGIGTATPLEKLHVSKAGDTATTGIIRAIMPDLATDGREVNIALGKSLAAGGTALWGYRYDTTAGDEGMYFTMYGDSANSLFIRKGGNVGIGTITPTQKLHIYQSAAAVNLLLQSDTNTQYTGSAILFDFDDSAGSQETFGKISTTLMSATHGAEDSAMTFQTRTGGAAVGEKMRIDGQGRVGIGVTSPDEELHVNGSADTAIRIQGVGPRVDTNTPSARLYFNKDITSGTVTANDVAGIILVNSDDASNNLGNSHQILFQTSGVTAGAVVSDIVFQTVNSAAIGTMSEAMRIQGGKVGINTSTPTQTLTVVGDLNVTGASYFGSQSFTNIDASGNLIVGKNLTVGGDNLFVDNSTGRVGIGTTNPQYGKLHIEKTTAGQAIYSLSNSTSGDNYGIDAEAIGAGGTSNTGGFFYATGATTNKGVYIFGTTAAANNYAIYSDAAAKSYFAGKVGIGTATPLAPLEITSSTGGTSLSGIAINNTAANGYSGIDMYNDLGKEFFISIGGSTAAAPWGPNNAVLMAYDATDNMVFGTSGAERMRIANSTGYVGIGTTDPSYPLDVQNSAKGVMRIYTSDQWDSTDVDDELVIRKANAAASPTGGYFGIRIGANDNADKAAGIYAVAEDAWANKVGMALYTFNGWSYAERMRISNTGQTYIGATTLTYPGIFNVVGGVSVGGTVYSTAKFVQDDTNAKGITLGYDTADQTGIIMADTISAASNIAFWTYSGAAWLERLRIMSDGTLRSTKLAFRGDSLEEWYTSDDSVGVAINYYGFLGSNSKFRDLNVYNGKGGQILTVDGSAGSVGIGTTSPGEKLEVNGNIRNSQLVLRSNGIEEWATNGLTSVVINYYGYNGGTTQFRDFYVYDGKAGNIMSVIGSTGKVGIGTTSPGAKLEVISGALSNTYWQRSTTLITAGANEALILQQNMSSDFDALRIVNSSGINTIWTMGRYGLAAVFPIAPTNQISTSVAGVGGSNFIVKSTGAVGIGLPSPGRRLSVNGTINISGTAEAQWSINGWDKRIEVPNNGIIMWYKGAGVVSRAMGQFGSTFYIGRSTADDNSQAVAVDMVINGSGYVGIGTSNPQTTLEVSSVIRSTPTDAPIACGAATEGGIYYDNSLNEFCDCNGTTPWWQIDNGGAC